MPRMILVRAWRRQLCVGLGAALIVPLALLTALGLLGLGGGFAGLGTLGQAVAGPALPDAARGVAPVPRPGKTISPTVLAALALSRTGSLQAGGGARRRAPVTAMTPPSLRPEPPSGSSRPPATRGTGTPQSATPPPPPTLGDRVAAAGTSATSQLPAPAGPAATALIQAAGSTVDQVAPVPAPAPPQLP